jgi:hypothetical protein
MVLSVPASLVCLPWRWVGDGSADAWRVRAGSAAPTALERIYSGVCGPWRLSGSSRYVLERPRLATNARRHGDGVTEWGFVLLPPGIQRGQVHYITDILSTNLCQAGLLSLKKQKLFKISYNLITHIWIIKYKWK